jgi:hypothetical protein
MLAYHVTAAERAMIAKALREQASNSERIVGTMMSRPAWAETNVEAIRTLNQRRAEALRLASLIESGDVDIWR